MTVAVLAAVAVARASAQEPPAETMTLRGAIEMALARSPELEAAEQGLRVANEMVREAWSSVLPDVSFSASYQRNLRVQEAFLPAIIFDPNAGPDDVIPVRFGSDNSWQASLTFSQPLFEATAFIGVGAAGRFRELEAERVRGTRQQVVSRVRQAFFGALLASEEQRLIQQSVARVRQTLEETRALNAAGLAGDYDVLRLEVQLANLEANLMRAENGVRAANRSLMVEMGLEAEAPVQLAGRLNEINLSDPAANAPANREILDLAGAGAPAGGVEDLVATAQRERADLRQLRSTIDLDEARFAVERAEHFPRVSAFSSYSVMAQENGSLDFFGAGPNQRTTSAIAGLRVELPIFSGFSRSSRMEQARATKRQDEARLERAESEATSQVRTLYEAVVEARQRAESQRAAVRSAQRGFEIASAEYRAGLGSQLQITDAEVALRETEFNYARAVYDFLVARSQLDLALGTVPVRPADFAARAP
jgi:outer membrane protein TolC